MSKHTPGPWECGPEINSDARLVYVPIRSQSTRVATTGVYGRKPNGQTTGEPSVDAFGIERHPPHITADECRANARLIKTSPKLLAACKDAEEVIEDRMDNASDFEAFNRWVNRCEVVAGRLRAAIAEAEETE